MSGRCVCCDNKLFPAELARKLPDGTPEDMCSTCRTASFHPKDWHEYQLEHLTEPLACFGNKFTKYSE